MGGSVGRRAVDMRECDGNAAAVMGYGEVM